MNLITLASLITIISHLLHESECLVCLSSFCPHDGLCNDYCTGSSDVCHLITHSLDLKEFDSVEMSCSHSTKNCTDECNPEPIGIGNIHYCCCTTDYCNHMPGETDHLIPILDIPTSLPSEPRPSNKNETVCENYHCIPDKQTCTHRYEVCEVKDDIEPFCSASYIVNAEGKLELKVKGCENEPSLLENCYKNTQCHIDNQLNDGVNDFHVCCCSGSYCNQEVSFTHPTEHSQYGLLECEALNCDQMCLIENNQPRCTCEEGYFLNGTSSCNDIDECELSMSQCDLGSQKCINTEGGYKCECKEGSHYDENIGKCKDDDGIVCDSYKCSNAGTDCVRSFEHCAITAPDDTVSDPRYHFCSSIFKAVNGSLVPSIFSCIHGAHSSCNNDRCIIQNKTEHITDLDLYSCCCYGDLCNLEKDILFLANLNSSDDSITPPSGEGTTVSSSMALRSTPLTVNQSSPLIFSTNDPSKGNDFFLADPLAIVFAVIVFFVVLLIVIATTAICVFKVYVRQKSMLTSMEVIVPPPGGNSPDSSTSALPILDTIIGQGRFAKVYCTKMNDEQVAIKIFNNSLQAKESWNREKEIYLELQHPNILRFLDANRHMCDGVDTFWLIFEYQPNGSLYDYLQHHTVSLKEFSTLAYSAACGLAHLHSELPSPDGGVVKKPPIAHRDLKSKNILVKQDMTSCISDFGLAIKLNSGEHQSDAQGQVGTSRYMAPEVLEGAISFHPESFLNIDVYAFGLVLWEIASRCDIPNNSVEEYRPPFEDIVSPNPSIAEMRRIVAEQRKRPKIPLGFMDKQGYESVVDSIVESWDSDAEARPSAHLIESRMCDFHEMVNSKHSTLKESGYLSHHAVPSSINLTTSGSPAPLTPCSSSPCVTLSPSDTKDMQFGSPSPISGHHPAHSVAAVQQQVDNHNTDQIYFRSSFHSSTFDSGNSEDIHDINRGGNSSPAVTITTTAATHHSLSISGAPYEYPEVEVECSSTRNSTSNAPKYGQLESSI